jgi:hypothetical protein
MSKNRWPATGASVIPTPRIHPTWPDFDLFGRLKQKLSGRTLESEENVLDTITEILRELPKDDVTRALVHWKERCQWVADHNGEFYPNMLNTKLL